MLDASSTINQSFGNLALTNFNEAPMPETLPILPFAPGWSYLAIIFITWLIIFIIQKLIYQINNHYRKSALLALAELTNSSLTEQARLYQLAELIKGTALYIFPREIIARQTGKDWFNFLNTHNKKQVFDSNAHQLLGDNLYQVPKEACTEKQWHSLIEQTKLWIQQHPYEGVNPVIKPFSLLNLVKSK